MNIEDIRTRFEASLMKLPNVIGVGIGRRSRSPVIEVLVTKKLPASALTQHEIIPESLEGYPVAVVEVGTPTAYEEEEPHGT